jgi:hypothetical protein
MQEQEDKSKKKKATELVVEVERTQKYLNNLSMLERSASTPEIIREEVLHSNPWKDPQQCEVTTLREGKNKNGKRNPKTQIR